MRARRQMRWYMVAVHVQPWPQDPRPLHPPQLICFWLALLFCVRPMSRQGMFRLGAIFLLASSAGVGLALASLYLIVAIMGGSNDNSAVKVRSRVVTVCRCCRLKCDQFSGWGSRRPVGMLTGAPPCHPVHPNPSLLSPAGRDPADFLPRHLLPGCLPSHAPEPEVPRPDRPHLLCPHRLRRLPHSRGPPAPVPTLPPLLHLRRCGHHLGHHLPHSSHPRRWACRVPGRPCPGLGPSGVGYLACMPAGQVPSQTSTSLLSGRPLQPCHPDEPTPASTHSRRPAGADGARQRPARHRGGPG